MSSRAARHSASSPSAFAPAAHDHQHCIDGALETATTLCDRRGARLTDIRRRVLQLVWRNHAPVGAYDILAQLARERPGAAPPTVYRALDFLLAQGLVHRLDSRNAYIGCAHPDEGHAGQFLICTGCDTVAEIDDPRIGAAVQATAAGASFSLSRLTVEMHGLCAACAESETHHRAE